MNKVIDINQGVYGVEAVYQDQVISEYQNNPFIESLPSIFSKENVIDKLTYYPVFDNNERYLDGQIRCHIIQRIFQFFQPLSIHLELESIISRMIRQGYAQRNPFHTNFNSGLIEVNNMIKNRTFYFSEMSAFSTTAYGLSIIGESGMGKSVSVNRILSLYPQLIIHSEYKGNLFSQYQLTWLKIDCPHDGSIKGLCLDFMMKTDNILGTNYYISSRNSSTNTLLPIIAQITRRCGLGLLIIDEIQNISLLKSGGAEKMLNFFMTLINTVGVPVILIGTNKAMSVLQGQFRQARRSVGQGTIFFERVKSSKEVSWKLFIEGLFEYQWLHKPVPLTQELSDTLYDESQGILDLAIKIYAMAQIKAIALKKEEISINLIKTIAQENLKLMRPMLDALRTGNAIKLSQYEDIAPIDMNEFINENINKVNYNNKIQEIQQLKKKNSININKKEEAILRLLDLDVEEKLAKKSVETVTDMDNDILEVKDIVKEAYLLIIGGKDSGKDSNNALRANKTKVQQYVENDIREIVYKGKADKLSAYDSLYKSGNIKPYFWNKEDL